MVKNIRVFEAVERFFKPPVPIYTAPIHKIYADRFELLRGNVESKKTLSIVNEKGTFVRSGLSFWNIDFDIKLPDIDEAMAYCENSTNIRKENVKDILLNPDLNSEVAVKQLEEISDETGCIYYVPGEVVYSHTISRDEYKELIKKNKFKRLKEIEEVQKAKRK